MEIRIPRLFIVIAMTLSKYIITVCYINVLFVTKIKNPYECSQNLVYAHGLYTE